MSQRKAAAHFEICRSTIKNKLKNKYLKKQGHPTVFLMMKNLLPIILYHILSLNSQQMNWNSGCKSIFILFKVALFGSFKIIFQTETW
jgi:hypothetical protein